MRPARDSYFMALAATAATRTTCIRRGVGCALVDADGYLLALAYNGVASGMPHCNEAVPRFEHTGFAGDLAGELDGEVIHPHVCPGHDLPPGQDSCEAVHAEQNAMIQCQDPRRIYTAYVTLSPCKPCLKLLLNTGCRRIVFLEEHSDPWPRDQWLRAGREWLRLAR